MSCGNGLIEALGETVTIYTGTRTAGATAGQKDATYTAAYTVSAIIEELVASDEMILAGGPVQQHQASMSVKWVDRAKLASGNLVKDSNNRVWRMEGVPALFGNVLAHAEITLQYLPNPPAGL